ncbi:restriction endonuclease subunit S [Anaerosalibacter bizertensis]|uniref:Restriction endonuclease subunit S n=1 Tax=Anaerosalibacter bizertensis TaxID=932217 RepID=A0A844FGF1_9FIRM|nr:restriction endonuclease subunit S [Anaerosalibacter bizertensis]MSS43025.1 restriction endonuclease subunit S [Anaerosalibacter bizertensis]
MKEQLVPELRFPEFEGEWEEKKLGEVCEIIMGQSPKSENYNDKEIGIPLIQGNADIKDRKTKPQFYTSEITKTCDIGDLILSVRAPVGHISRSEHHACIGRGVCVIKTKQENFIYFYLIRNEKLWKRYEQGSTFTAINSDAINKFSLIIPNPQEQQKIGDFFYKIDKKLELQQEKIENLKKYKKGMMQRIFSQEIRFKDDNGKDYPDWEEKKLGEISNIKTGSTNVQDAVDNGKYIFFDRSIVVKRIDIYNYDEEAIIYPGEGSEFHPRYYKGKYALHQRAYSITSNRINMMYLNYMLGMRNKHFLRMAVGSTVKSLRMDNFETCSIFVPIKEEQIKIANLLSSIDKKIGLEEEKLEEYKKFKKGLMQRMFI